MSGKEALEKARNAHDRIDEHEEIVEAHDRRIRTNENWRLQAQGALKIIGLIIGAGGLAAFLDIVMGAI